MHLTNTDASHHILPVASEGAAGAPVCEIEITPEMIEAGIGELSPSVICDLRDGWIRPSVVAVRLFSAMLLASKL